ncbi:MAG: hypothetical protein JEY99_20030 [Spirochaetales bacterium]|nr:hypothetical protein [Spirochaetales bacterium]
MTEEEKARWKDMSKEEKKEFEAEFEKEVGAEIEAEIEERLEKRFGSCGGDNSWWEEKNIAVKFAMGLGIAILGVGAGALCILVVMKLWNWLMPEIFGLTTLTYWKAGGLMLLSWILFKNWNFKDNDTGNDRRRRRELRRRMRDDE